MGILKHRFTVADFLPLVANEALIGGRLVKPAAANGPTPRVALTTAATEYAIGAVEEDAVVDQRVSVSTRGVQQLTASGAIAFNTDVVPAAAGRVAQAVTPATDRVYGRALQAAAALGDKIWVLKYQ
jgi:hypothetical protein